MAHHCRHLLQALVRYLFAISIFSLLPFFFSLPILSFFFPSTSWGLPSQKSPWPSMWSIGSAGRSTRNPFRAMMGWDHEHTIPTCFCLQRMGRISHDMKLRLSKNANLNNRSVKGVRFTTCPQHCQVRPLSTIKTRALVRLEVNAFVAGSVTVDHAYLETLTTAAYFFCKDVF